MLAPDIYYLKNQETVTIRLLPNIDNLKNPFYSKMFKVGRRSEFIEFKHYVFSKIENKYVVFYTGKKIHDFISKEIVEGLNPFDLKEDIALKVSFKKIKEPWVFGNIVIRYTTELSFERDKKHIIWDGTEKDKERVIKYLKNKKFTLEEMAERKRPSINSVSDFKEINPTIQLFHSSQTISETLAKA